jgi:hypothetical protein
MLFLKETFSEAATLKIQINKLEKKIESLETLMKPVEKDMINTEYGVDAYLHGYSDFNNKTLWHKQNFSNQNDFFKEEIQHTSSSTDYQNSLENPTYVSKTEVVTKKTIIIPSEDRYLKVIKEDDQSFDSITEETHKAKENSEFLEIKNLNEALKKELENNKQEAKLLEEKLNLIQIELDKNKSENLQKTSEYNQKMQYMSEQLQFFQVYKT